MISQSLRNVLESLNSGNVEKVVAHFAPNAKVFTENFSAHSGLPAIRAALARRVQAAGSVRLELIGEPEIRNVTDDVAIVECDFESKVSSHGTPNKGRSVSVVKKNGDTWQIDCQWLICRP